MRATSREKARRGKSSLALHAGMLEGDTATYETAVDPTDRRVTVVIPTRFRPHMAEQAIRSCLRQEGVSPHVVVVVDGPDAETAALLARFPQDRVELVAKAEREGVSAARNTGIDVARTPWVALLDDDDLWAPSKLADQFARLRETKAAWCVTTVVTFDAVTNAPIAELQPPDEREIPRQLLTRNVLHGGSSSVLAPRSLFISAGGFETSLDFAEDWDLFIRLADLAQPCVVRQPVVACRIWRESVSFDTSAMEAASRIVLDRYGDRRRAQGISDDWAAIQRYLARQDARSRRRLASARRFVQAFASGRDPRDLLRAAIAGVSPAVLVRAMDRSARDSVSDDAHAMFERWYEPLLAMGRSGERT